MRQFVLLISCPDEKGLVFRVTGALYKRDLNIVENAEYVDRKAGYFYMRTQFTGEVRTDELIGALAQELPAATRIQLREQTERKLILFATREPHCLGDLLLRHASDELPGAKICAVVSQYDDLKPLSERFGIPFRCVSAKGITREEHEDQIFQMVQDYEPDYLILAKYMRILSPDFVAKFESRILNIHHSFLPAFVGSKPYQQAYERGVKIVGATAHFVNESLDEGPIITQSVIPVGHAHSAAEMSRSGRDIERIVLARALKLILEDRVIVHGRRTLVFE